MLNKLNLFGDFKKKLFFCGIGGASMLGLAQLAKELGYTVIGSDSDPSKTAVKTCAENQIKLYTVHCESNVIGCDVFIYSAAIRSTNPELVMAKKLGLSLLTRSEFLGMISSEYKTSIAVSGTHGKSTTTQMIYEIFKKCERSPTLLGGAASYKNGSYVSGSDQSIIYEACEYNRSFLSFYPSLALILNIEKEHVDTYPTLLDAELAYFQFAGNSGTCILNLDSPVCRKVGDQLSANGGRVLYFSIDNENADLYCKNLRTETGAMTYTIVFKNGECVECKPRIRGIHNVSNALAAALVGYECGMNPRNIVKAIDEFEGILRRFEYIGSVNGADVYDDYAHHPSEIIATLEMASKLGYQRIICAFQPHTYSRTYAFFDEFCSAFKKCDEVIFADIYPAREINVYGVSSQDLAKNTPNAIYIQSPEMICKHLITKAKKSTLIITMGAGKMNEVARFLTEMHNKGNNFKNT